MRKSVLIPVAACLAAVTMFTACKKDKKEELTGRKAQLVGSWQESFSALDNNDNKLLDEDEKDPVDAADAVTVAFKADGTGNLTGAIEGPITWTLIDNEQSLVVTLLGEADTSRIHTLDNTSLILESDGDQMSWNGHTKK